MEMGVPADASILSPFGEVKSSMSSNKNAEPPLWFKLREAGDAAYATGRHLAAAEHYTDSLALMLGLKDKSARNTLLIRRAAGKMQLLFIPLISCPRLSPPQPPPGRSHWRRFCIGKCQRKSMDALETSHAAPKLQHAHLDEQGPLAHSVPSFRCSHAALPRPAAFSAAGRHAQALWDAELAIQEGGQARPVGALLVRAISRSYKGDTAGSASDIVRSPPSPPLRTRPRIHQRPPFPPTRPV